eukprot:scaffold136027_cov71-Attheya_sp.AAC.1
MVGGRVRGSTHQAATTRPISNSHELAVLHNTPEAGTALISGLSQTRNQYSIVCQGCHPETSHEHGTNLDGYKYHINGKEKRW